MSNPLPHNTLQGIVTYTKTLLSRGCIEKLRYEVGFIKADTYKKNVNEIINKIIKEFIELKPNKTMNTLAIKLKECLNNQKEITLSDAEIGSLTELSEYMGKMEALESLQHQKKIDLRKEIEETREEFLTLLKESGMIELFTPETLEKIEENIGSAYVMGFDGIKKLNLKSE